MSIAMYYLVTSLAFCVAGEMISTAYAKVGDAVYGSSAWYESSPRIRRQIVMIIRQSQQPNYLKGLGLNAWECSLENFTNVMCILLHWSWENNDLILNIAVDQFLIFAADLFAIFHLSWFDHLHHNQFIVILLLLRRIDQFKLFLWKLNKWQALVEHIYFVWIDSQQKMTVNFLISNCLHCGNHLHSTRALGLQLQSKRESKREEKRECWIVALWKERNHSIRSQIECTQKPACIYRLRYAQNQTESIRCAPPKHMEKSRQNRRQNTTENRSLWKHITSMRCCCAAAL